eukprot:c17886_g1_i3 orf=144-2522(+)
MPAVESNNLSRKEKRRNARKAKNQACLQARAAHQAKKKKSKTTSQTHAVSEFGSERRQSKSVKPKKQMSSWGGNHKSNKRKRPSTKFEEYLALEENKTAGLSAEEDMALERRLARKLKVKHGLFHDTSDGLSDLLEGIVSSSDVMEKTNKDRKSAKGLQSVSELDEAGEFSEDEENDMSDESGSEDSAFEGVLGEDRELDGDSSSMDEEAGGELLDTDDEGDQLHKTLLGAEEAGEQLHHCEQGEGEAHRKGRAGQVKAASKADDEPSPAMYVAPHRRVEDTSSNEQAQLQRRSRGLLNRLSEDNVESIAPDIFSLFQVHGRRIMTDIITNEILGALCSGPRGNEQYAAVFAAFVAGVASSIGMDFGAKFLASFAENLEEQRKQEDSLAVRNMVLLLSYLYIFKLISCEVIYDLLCLLSKTLTELDVAIILTVLQTCGMGLRADDPAAMKDFVQSVQHRCEELKASAVQSGTIFYSGKRMQFMLETIFEIKNNKRRVKQDAIPHVRLKKWLQKLGIEDVQLRALKWKQLLDPDKKGQWWISGGSIDQGEGGNSEVAEFIHKESGEAEKMLQLAASQKMNTDIRRAIFCVVMSGEDYLDAFEKILRIKLTGKQDREIMRVIVECCLQEKAFNKYYSLLIDKLCHHDKNHKFTLQYCLWDHFKQLSSMETRRLANLAHLLADLIAKFSLSLSVLKVVEFADTKTMTPKAVLFFRIFLRVLLTGFSDEIVLNAFMRIASSQELEDLRIKLSVFLHQHLIKGTQGKGSHATDNEDTLILRRFAMVKKAMATLSTLQ